MKFPDIPVSYSSYMKLEKGENRFRILDNPVAGYEYWQEDSEGKKTPIRKKSLDEVDFEEQGTDKARYFWAFPVWNYAENLVQILELTQKSILREIKNLGEDTDWGDSRFYDIKITRTGEDMETRYSVSPKPKEKLSQTAKEEWVRVQKEGFDLTRLFENGNPFGEAEETTTEEEDMKVAKKMAKPKKTDEEEVTEEDFEKIFESEEEKTDDEDIEIEDF